MNYCSVVDLTKELKPRRDIRYKARLSARQGVTIARVPFKEFKDFYVAHVSVEKTEERWNELEKMFFCYMAKKDGVPITAAAFQAYGKQVYYAMAVTDFASPYSKRASYLLQTEVMKSLQQKGYELYIVGLLYYGDDQKLQRISDFKRQFGDVYFVEGDAFPFTSYMPAKEEVVTKPPNLEL